MITTSLRRALLAASVVVAAVGGIDAVRGGQEDLAVLFGVLIVVLGVVLRWSLVGFPRTSVARRAPVMLRTDLVAWLEERNALTGEPVERIADRAVADQRARADRPRTADEERTR